MNEAVMAAIRDAIGRHGIISFAEFMELALYSPGGFYDEPPVGEEGHFVTSPHVHPMFAELLGRALRSLWEALGRPDPFAVIELGAGDGTLARQLLTQLHDVPLAYTAVDRSAGARARLNEIEHIRVAASLEAVEHGLTGCIFGNELLDNLPFHRVRRTREGLRELCVTLDDDRLVLVERPLADDLLEEVPEAEVRFHTEAALSLDAFNLIYRVATTLDAGYALFIDYEAVPDGPVHGYRAQRLVADVLSDPGTADVTAGVRFDWLAQRAESLGMQAFPRVTQASALRALGFDQWAGSALERQAGALRERAGREAVTAWSERQRAAELVRPDGLGNLQWMVLGTRVLAEPAWLNEARLLEATVMRPPIEGRRRRRRQTKC